MKFSCPKCKSRVEIQTTFNKKIHVSCTKCSIEDIVEFVKNPDEAFLEFLTRYDKGMIKNIRENLIDQSVVRSKAEIAEMIGKRVPSDITRNILYTTKDYISEYRVLNSKEPELGCDVSDLDIDEPLINYLTDIGISKLYKFQQDTFSEILSGNNVIIEAPTASGKTEAFLIPTVQRVKNECILGRIHAIFVYPTKSLARDQYYKIKDFASNVGIRAKVFDGDTTLDKRRDILENPPQLLITNFDTIHYHLWHQTRFGLLVSTARILIVDEVHTYSGIFGTNVHYIIKRLKRVCGDLQFIAASATINDAKQFTRELFGEEMKLIKSSGRKGEIEFVMLFPTLRTQRSLMLYIAKQLAKRKHKTMIFNNSHFNSEIFAIQARKQKINIKVHRAGLMAKYRQSVEQQFKTGVIDAISCTPTLELGIDIGNVDGVISATVPINRLVQRIGRAGRRGQRGYAFLTLGNDPISQYYRNHPDDYFEDIEHNYIDPQNPFVKEYQILAAACDKPLLYDEIDDLDIIKYHMVQKNLVKNNDMIYPNLKQLKPLLDEYSIRGMGRSIDITLNGKKMGDRVLPIALEELHRDAVYFLAGTKYRVLEFNYPKDSHASLVEIPRDYPFYTRALTEEWPTVETTYETRIANGVQISFCKLHIQKTVHGYVKLEIGQEIKQGERVPLDLPLEYDFVTKGIVFCAPPPVNTIDAAEDRDYVEASGYHATEHIIIEGSNMITGGVSQDLGGISMGTSGMIYIYDGAIGGSGASKALYDRFEQAIERSRDIVSECPCANAAGCPRCTFSYRCGNNNEFLHKHAALEILERINDGEDTRLVQHDGHKPFV